MNTTDRYSIVSLWEDLNRALQQDRDKNETSYESYQSVVMVACVKWMAEAGKALKIGDKKTARGFLYNIQYQTADMLPYLEKPSNGHSEDYLKPYREFQLAAIILMLKLDNISY